MLAACAAAAAIASPRIVLVGDSTMAAGNGYGDALCERLRAVVSGCVNLARNGRSTKSYREEGLWAKALETAGSPGERPVYLLIQLGHNDQPGKPGRSTELASEYPANLARMVDEARAAAAVPVLITPLTRRTFRDGRLDNDLRPWAESMIAVARSKSVPMIDLNWDSAARVELMGEARADRLAMTEPGKFDRTHLGPEGAALFGGLVADALAVAIPDLGNARAAAPRPQLSEAQAKAFAYARVVGGGEGWDPLRAGAEDSPPVLVVGPAGAQADFHRIQDAVDAIVRRGERTHRATVLVRPGRYDELVYVPPSAPPITLRGTGEKAGDVRIGVALPARTSALDYARRFGAAFESSPLEVRTMFNAVHAQAEVGTPGSAAVWIRADGFEARNLTFANEYNRGNGDREEAGAVHSQAVAVLVDDADRVLFDGVRIEGFQDTLFLRQSRPQPGKRTFVHRSVVEGDMDFIFGEATAYFLESEIRTIGARPLTYVAAPSTHADSPYGFVFERCRFTSDGSAHTAAGRFKLARQWFRAPLAVGKMMVLHSAIGSHVDRAQPWADWNSPATGRYRAVRFGSESGEPWLAEYENE